MPLSPSSAPARRRTWRAAGLAIVLFLLVLSAGPTKLEPVGSSTAHSSAGELYTILGPDGGAGIELLVLDGTPWEMGWQAGVFLQDDVRAAVQSAHALCTAENSPPPLSCPERAHALRELLTPSLLEEARGLAVGAGVSEADILLLNSLFADLFPSSDGGDIPMAGFAAWGEAAADGQTYLGMILPALGAGDYRWVVRRPTEGTATALLTIPGWLGGIAGLNEAGLAGGILPAPTLDTESRGIAAPLLLREALESTSTPDDALTYVLGRPRADGAQVVFGTEPAGAVGMEWSARMARRLSSDANTLAVTGFFQHPDLSLVQLPLFSEERFARAETVLSALRAQLRANSGWFNIDKGLLLLARRAGNQENEGLQGCVLMFVPGSDEVWMSTPAQGSNAFLGFEPLSLPAPR